jgi:diguanylate cyclase (GGDEF)-like protein
MVRHSPSLVSAGRLFVAASVTYVAVAAGLSFSFMREIENDARFTRDRQIPAILAQNANAVKVEKLVSLVRSAFLARDARLERQVQLEMRVLSQTFTLDGDRVLIDGSRTIADDVRAIIALRAAERGGPGAGPDAEAKLRATYDDAMRTARRLADHLADDAALVADTVSKKIEANAGRIKNVWFLILAVPVLGSLVLFWLFRTHVARPIDATVARLTAIGTQRFDGTAPPAPFFVELRTIAAAVETYGEVSVKLNQTNAVLKALSVEDALTGVGNRRSFDATLEAEFAAVRERGGELAVLVVDLDHFKRVNDEHGHQAGDSCLKTVGKVLHSLCGEAGCRASRYGGEEFAVLLPGRNLAEAAVFAETLRLAVEAAAVPRAGMAEPIRITASIGVAALDEAGIDSASALLAAADAALYRAKRRGRNNVQRHTGTAVALPGSGHRQRA